MGNRRNISKVRSETRQGEQYGVAPIGITRYLAVYLVQLAWLGFGYVLYTQAVWPSSCTPDELVEIYTCSEELLARKGLIETGLVIWLWVTPLLIVMAILRRKERPR